MTPTSPSTPLSASSLYNKLQKLVGSTVTQLMVYGMLLISVFATLQLATVNTYAQATGEINTIGSIGFKECNFVSGGGTTAVAVVNDPDAQFQKCIGSIIQFFFALALFIIAVRIGVEAFANVNPAEAGKAVSNTITLVRDVTVGLLLIGSPGIFLSFFNPTTLSLAGIINLQRLSGAPKDDGIVRDASGKEIGTRGEAGVIIPKALEYKDLTAEQAAELAKDPEKFARENGIQLNVIKENFLADLKSGKIDWKDAKNGSLMNFLSKENGYDSKAIIKSIICDGDVCPLNTTDETLKKYSQWPAITASIASKVPFTLKNTGRTNPKTPNEPELKYYTIECGASGSVQFNATSPFGQMCDKTIRLNMDACKNNPALNNPSFFTSNIPAGDNCLGTAKIISTDGLK